MTSTSLFFILGQWFFQQILGLDELYLRMKEAKLSVSNDITNTTETHARGLSWKTQEEGLQLEAATNIAIGMILLRCFPGRRGYS